MKTRPAGPTRPIAVIDIGSNAVRMDVAEPGRKGGIRKLESAQQAVTLGRDAFSRGVIENPTINECIQALKGFRKILLEYGLEPGPAIRAVATTAVRESQNRDTFLDRVESATGFRVTVLEEAEVNRYLFLSVRPVIDSGRLRGSSDLMVLEVGAGSTELLIIRKGSVVFSQSFRLGALRLRETLEDFRDSPAHLRDVVKNQTLRTLEQVRRLVGREQRPELLCLGGDLRYAFASLHQGRPPGDCDPLTLRRLTAFTDQMAAMPVDDLVRTHHLPFIDAESLAPSLLIYTRMARELSLPRVLVSSRTMRDGLFDEMIAGADWIPGFRQQIIGSALETGRKYGFESGHAAQVASLSGRLFEALTERHRLGAHHGLLLQVAALLHDTGLFISNHDHHKHSMYLILNSNIFGLASRDILIAALIARYHRRALPDPSHEGFRQLSREERQAVSKLAALLRIADALDRRQDHRTDRLDLRIAGDDFIMRNLRPGDLTVEQLAVRKKGDLFERVYGLRPVLQKIEGE